MRLEIPNHIAIVMDGNGRWAQRRGHPRIFGHVRGSSRVKMIVKEAVRLGIKALTLYAFSTENWLRPEAERQVLWKLLRKYLVREGDELSAQNIKLRIIGEVDRLGSEVRDVLDPLLERLNNNTGLQLTFAISYGSRRELVRAAQLFAKDCISGKCTPDSMNEKLMENYLWTADFGSLSKVDLFIRTSGEQRLSNFLLWQSAYAEYVFTDVCWPDFEAKDLLVAVQEYSKRERRYGGVSAPPVENYPIINGNFGNV